jgi:hypothetical protein
MLHAIVIRSSDFYLRTGRDKLMRQCVKDGIQKIQLKILQHFNSPHISSTSVVLLFLNKFQIEFNV